MKKLFLLALSILAFPTLATNEAKAQTCRVVAAALAGGTLPVDSQSVLRCLQTGELVTSAAVSASITGFPTTQSTGTPIAVTTSGVTGTLPTGAVVVATNAGTTNAAYCKLGASATTSDQFISPNGGWFAFTVGASTQLTCITSTSTTTVNMVGGSGLPTGTGGGGGGGSGIATNVASVASWTTATGLNTVVTVPNAGNYPANQISLSASANVTAGAVTFQGTKADGTDETIPIAQVLNPNTLARLTNPYTLTTSKNDFLIATQGYQTIKVKLTTAITTSSGAGTTVISNTNVPYNPVVSALLNPLSAGTAIIGKVGIDQTTPGTTNLIQPSVDVCTYSNKVNFPVSFQTTTLTQQIAASGSNKIYICSISLIASAATVFSLSGGTGSNCASNQLGILGVAGVATHGLSLAANGGITYGNGTGTVAVTAASSEICLVQSGSGDLSGNITYVYAP